MQVGSELTAARAECELLDDEFATAMAEMTRLGAELMTVSAERLAAPARQPRVRRAISTAPRPPRCGARYTVALGARMNARGIRAPCLLYLRRGNVM